MKCNCGDVKLFGELAKCKEHSKIHTLKHMSLKRYLKYFFADPLYYINQKFDALCRRKRNNFIPNISTRIKE